MTVFRDVRVIADAGDGADIENMQVIDTGSSVTVVQSDYAQKLNRTVVIVAHGLVVLPHGRITPSTAKAYQEGLPNALRRAGVLHDASEVITGVDTPPRDSGAVDGDRSFGPGDVRLHGKRPFPLQHVFNALRFFRRWVRDPERCLRA